MSLKLSILVDRYSGPAGAHPGGQTPKHLVHGGRCLGIEVDLAENEMSFL